MSHANTTGGSRINYTITEHTTTKHKQEKRGRPGPNTRYRKIVATHHQIRFTVNEPRACPTPPPTAVSRSSPTTPPHRRQSSPYRYQPNLERRNHILKDHQTVAPVYLQAAHRIEALLLCQFLALLTGALIERHIRNNMNARQLTNIALPRTPALHRTSAQRILQIFAGAAATTSPTPPATPSKHSNPTSPPNKPRSSNSSTSPPPPTPPDTPSPRPRPPTGQLNAAITSPRSAERQR
ncbi:MAG: hypothetical protein IPQ14_17585 [Candidatus Microthrix sp.]|uniref:hypothetical protein n=1 Tax=Candidatus Neomicrothrix sp. TaxID=2719034 RepID=UPI0025C6E892|nr:hypothetical protein [Candidatus Microthrix sp.]MBL0206081.1 hypothetical protein [Candidatus Microthrix sp.]